MESNMDYLNGIDFRKGCYVGQELTIRTQHTGVIRKRILPVQLYTSTSTPPSELFYESTGFAVKPGADIKAEGGKRPAGKFLASVGNVGLALCRLENMTDLRVSAEGGTWKKGMEFNITVAEGEQKVKVKAFVPEWLRLREQEKMERRARREENLVD
jgi:folate-binding Fe-S cluster repair protein YgfZ